MRLSDAIRLGAMLKPQRFGAPNNRLTLVDQTCALAAAAEACGFEHLNVRTPEWAALFGWAERVYLGCPVAPCSVLDDHGAKVRFVIVHLNDYHHWTREQIADFVQTIEESRSAPAVREDVAAPIVSTRD